jgi:hypothetical protein
MMAFNTAILALDAGYYSTRKTPLLGAHDWSTLSSAAVVAIGRGYARSHSDWAEEFLDIICRTNSMNKSDPGRPFK